MSMAQISKSAIVLPTPTLIWTLTANNTRHVFHPNEWLFTEFLKCMPEVATFISETMVSIMDPFDPIEIPLATTFRRTVLVRGIHITPDRVQHAYRSSIACARESHAEELWIGALNDIHGKDPTVAAYDLAMALMEFCLKEAVLFGRIRLERIRIFVTGRFVREEHVRCAIRYAIGSLC